MIKEKKDEVLKILGKMKDLIEEEKFLQDTDVLFKGKKYWDKFPSIEEMAKLVSECRQCHLWESRTLTVFGEGTIPSRVMFVGEGPGFEEDRQGRPFVGRAGQLLTKIIESIGLKREGVYITNMVKCHPMINPKTPDRRGNDRPPTNDEMVSCRPYLEAQFYYIKPEIIVTLGNSAAQSLLENASGITRMRGRFYPFKNIKLLPTFHPAALLRSPELKKYVWEDMKLLKKELKI
ncbi:MAG: uracil-DNA glycosylase [Elusimicrobiota bacterium]